MTRPWPARVNVAITVSIALPLGLWAFHFLHRFDAEDPVAPRAAAAAGGPAERAAQLGLMRHRGGVERGVLIGLAGLRWAAWLGLACVALFNLHHDHHPVW